MKYKVMKKEFFGTKWDDYELVGNYGEFASEEEAKAEIERLESEKGGEYGIISKA